MFFSRAKRKRTERANDVTNWDLDTPLLNLGSDEFWTIRDALEGTLVLGATGSGKSSGSGCAIASAMIAAGFGGIVLTAKSDERRVWEGYCRAAGRESDLRIFGPDAALRFNFLDYERTRGGAGAGLTENIVQLFSTVLEVASRDRSGGRDDEGYWRRAMKQLIRNCVDLLMLAGDTISVPNLYSLVVSAPTSLPLLASAEWRARSACYRWLGAAEGRAATPRQKRDFNLVADYFTVEFPSLSDKTRSVIVSTFTSLVDVLNRGVLRDLFSADTNVTPEDAEHGRILLIDLPVKEFAEVGQIAQVIWKYAFQRAIERRDVSASSRPVFLWADEAHHFLTSYDQLHQTTCRAARVVTAYLSQNVGNFHAALGEADAGEAHANSLFGNLNTKFFHANGDPETNQWASSLIGRCRQMMTNGSSSRESDLWSSMAGFEHAGQHSAGFNEVYEFEVQPGEFTRLRTGGPKNGNLVDAIVVRNGRVFHSTNRVWIPVTFRQG